MQDTLPIVIDMKVLYAICTEWDCVGWLKLSKHDLKHLGYNSKRVEKWQTLASLLQGEAKWQLLGHWGTWKGVWPITEISGKVLPNLVYLLHHVICDMIFWICVCSVDDQYTLHCDRLESPWRNLFDLSDESAPAEKHTLSLCSWIDHSIVGWQMNAKCMYNLVSRC